MTDVQVVSISSDALDWLRLGMVIQLGIGVTIIVLLAALVVAVLWRG